MRIGSRKETGPDTGSAGDRVGRNGRSENGTLPRDRKADRTEDERTANRCRSDPARAVDVVSRCRDDRGCPRHHPGSQGSGRSWSAEAHAERQDQQQQSGAECPTHRHRNE